MLSKCKRIYQIGLKQSAIIAAHRLQQWHFAYYWRKKILSYRPDYSIDHIAFKALPFVHALCQKQDHQCCIEKAGAVVSGQLSILGSKKCVYETIPWHTDIRLAQQYPDADTKFDADIFYRDIKIKTGAGDSLLKDIKVPWELSRSQQLPILGHAYLQDKNEIYAKKIIEWCQEWIKGNLFLYGVNWCNPMEVGLRALNWIIALSMIRESSTIDSCFMQKTVHSLYEHMIFIEGNWEWYDGKTSNHYLSDLVGYLYLTWFFDERTKCMWVVAELEREMCKQILPDGASYEGSTRYHRLVTELFYYARLLIEHENIQLSDTFVKKYNQMNEFLWWCTPIGGKLVTIGDDDSGCVAAFGINKRSYFAFRASKDKPFCSFVLDKDLPDGEVNICYFKNFGLSVYKSSHLHVTLRHHAYTAEQPSGHFHNDIGSTTLSIDGIPVIVDPGSYVYTPSVRWRNYFRSVARHNVSYVRAIEPASLTDQLFYLGQQERENSDRMFCARQVHYQHLGALLERNLVCTDTMVTIYDNWYIEKAHEHTLSWNFTLHPEIDPVVKDKEVVCMHNGRSVATFYSDHLQFYIENAFVAPSYGQKKATKCIRASAPFATIHTEIIVNLI